MVTNGDFSGGGITDGTLFGQAEGETRVSVSADGDAWFLLNPELAPVLDAYFPTDGGGDFSLPVNPILAKGDFAEGGLAKFTELYAGSGGGSAGMRAGKPGLGGQTSLRGAEAERDEESS